jgi:hypothetical protein
MSLRTYGEAGNNTQTNLGFHSKEPWGSEAIGSLILLAVSPRREAPSGLVLRQLLERTLANMR